MTQTNPQNTVDAINSEIAKHEDTIRCLKSRRNTLALISRLPVEILCHIFILISRDSTQSQWIRVSHVCTRWRHAALGCPALWSTLTFKSAPEWVHEMIKRSMDAPLTVHANMAYGTPMMRNAVAEALDHIERTAHLALSGPLDDMQTTLASLNRPAPFLRVLSLSQNPVPSLITRLSIPDNLLSGYAPSLRKLKIQFCHLGWTSALLNNLTHLVVRSPGEDGTASIDELLTVLGNMPLLENLELYDALKAGNLGGDCPNRVRGLVHLPRLLELHIGSDIMAVTELLHHLSIPLATKVNISVEGSAFCNSSLAPFLSALNGCARHSTRLLHRSIDTLSVTSGSSSYLRIQAWPDEYYDRIPFLILELDWLEDGAFPSIEPALTSISDMLPCSRIRALRLSSTVGRDLSSMELLVRCYNVENIALENATFDFIGVIGIPSRKGNNGRVSQADTSSLAFPSLRTLCIRNGEFSLGVDYLRRALATRVSRDMQLHTLELEECLDLYEEDVDSLTGLAKEVIWDGVEQGTSEDSGSDITSTTIEDFRLQVITQGGLHRGLYRVRFTFGKTRTNLFIMDNIEGPRNTGLAEIDAQIAQYESAVRDLKSQRNMLAPISRLPIEVLCHIFVLTTYATHTPYWMAVTHVCSHWRTAALKCPAMWSYITFERPSRCTNEMLERSKQAPLTLQLLDNWRLGRMLKTVSTALEHIGRTVELRLRGDFSMLTKSLNQPAPHLHTLALEYRDTGSYSGIPWQSVSLPDDFLGGDTPRLRHLELKQCYLNWNSGILKGLTHLELKGPTSHLATILEVTSVLRNTPMLEVLQLYGILESVDAATYAALSRPQDLITLAHLSRLHIHSGVVPATKLLLHLSFPSNVVIDMSVNATVDSTVDAQYDFGPFLSALNECGVNSTKVLDRSMNTFCLDSPSFSNSLRVRVWPNQGPCMDSPPFQLVMTWDTGSASYSARTKCILQNIGDAFPLSRTRNLRFQLSDAVSGFGPASFGVFEACQQVKSLALEHAAYNFIKALGTPNRQEDGTETVKFPNLRELSIVDTEFSDGVGDLKVALQFRGSRKARLRLLKMESCVGLYHDDVLLLEPLVGKMEWDHQEQDPEMSDEDSESMYDEDDYYDDVYSYDPWL